MGRRQERGWEWCDVSVCPGPVCTVPGYITYIMFSRKIIIFNLYVFSPEHFRLFYKPRKNSVKDAAKIFSEDM